MKNLIPHFISDRFKEGIYKGKFEAVTMFMDISGFTQMTERLMKEDKEGAEVLSNILNNVFEPVIKAVYDRNGFITVFAGDSFTAVFMNPINLLNPLFSAIAIQKIFKMNELQKTKYGDFELSVKIGLSYGNVDWGIIGNEKHKIYYFKGNAINGCANSEHHSNKMEIVIDYNLLNLLIYNIEYEKIDEHYTILTNVNEPEPKSLSIKVSDISADILSQFLPDEVVKYNKQSEFRNIVSVFISFKEPDSFSKLENFIGILLKKVDLYNGYFEVIDFGDKGCSSLIIFGIPISYENIIERAISFVNELRNELNDNFRAGITYGTVYAGVKGSSLRCQYGVLGDVVNLSSRFMMEANFGQIWISKSILDKAKGDYDTIDLGEKEFKGKSEPIPVFDLLEKNQHRAMKFFEGEMVGRQKEYDILRSYCKTILDGKFSGVVYVYGEAGIGKSRLVYEATESLIPEIDILTLQTDSILQHSLNPFSFMLKNYFKQYQCKTDEERKKTFEKIYNAMLSMLSTIQDERMNELIKELERTKSVIGALIGLHWEGSLYEQLNPKGRYENTLHSIKAFFKAHSLIRPLIIILEDLHWLDNDSKEEFKLLTRNIDYYPIIIISTSRINDDGTKPKLILGKEVSQSEINIDYLSNDAIELFIEKQLKNKPNNELINFITSKSLGNPFYIEQFCLYLLDNKLIKIVDGLYSLTKKDIEIPIGINALIIARIDRLSMELKEMVQLASVLGREVDIIILSELMKAFGKAIEKSKFDKLVHRCENEQIWLVLSEIKYIFKHTLLRDVVYDMQLRERLRILHRFTADIIEKLYENKGERYSEIAYHFNKGEEFEKAKVYYEKAGDYFKDNFKNQEAIEQYNRLLDLLFDNSKIVGILNKKGSILELIGKWDLAEEIYKKNIDISTKISDKKVIAENKRLLGNIIMNKGQYDEAIALFEEAKSIAEEIGDKKLYSSVVGNMGIVRHSKGDYDNAMKCYEEQKQICLEIGDKRIYSMAVGNMGIVYNDKGDYDNAMKYYEEQKQICLEIGDKGGYSRVVGNIGILYNDKGDYDNAMKYYEEQKQICLEIGDKSGYSMAVGNMGNVYIGKCDYDNAIKSYEKAMQVCRELGNKYYLCGYLNSKAKLLFHIMNRIDESKFLNDETLKIAIEIGRQDMIFEATVLKHKIDKNADALLGMLSESKDDEQIATIHYELWKMTSKKEHSEKAIELYKQLYEKTPKYEFKKRIEEMKK